MNPKLALATAMSPVGPDVNVGDPGGVTSTVMVPPALAADDGPERGGKIQCLEQQARGCIRLVRAYGQRDPARDQKSKYLSLRGQTAARPQAAHGQRGTGVRKQQALSQWGERALEELDGMFALAFYEARNRRVLLARDHLGIKPLYVARPRGALVFASEIRAVLAAAREGVQNRVIAVVQPHRFTRLRDHLAEFQAAFNDADIVYAAPVYAAGEAPIEGIDSAALVAGIKARGHRSAQLIASADALAAELANMAQPGDMVVCLGAGDITKWAGGLEAAIRVFRTGG